MKPPTLLIILLGCAFLQTFPARGEGDTKILLEYVKILQGTDSNSYQSHGNTLPLLGMPWGMVNWTIQNETNTTWFFKPNGQINGLRATHQPSPWIGDYGQFVLMPQAGDLQLKPSERITDYDPKTAVLRPDYLKLGLKKGTITVELTGTERCGVFRLTYHEGTTGRLILDACGDSEIKLDGRTIYGISRANSGGVPKDEFASYFVIKLDRDITKSELFPQKASDAKPNQSVKDAQGYVEFTTLPREPVILKVGTSLISWEQAERNLRTETQGDFDVVRARVAGVWNTNLGKIEIKASTEEKSTFYSCLYRAQMFPHRLYELDAAGKPIHFSPYDGKIHEGVLYGDIGIWDGFRTTFPLITILYPAQLNEILQGFVNASVEGDGTLPEWPSPGYRKCMIGQHCAAIFADALAKGQTRYDVAKAYKSLRRSAFEIPADGVMVREGMADYLKLGYTPGARSSVSTTLDYAYDDWCVAQMARILKHPEDARILMTRSQNYRKVWDPSVGFMRGKNAEGKWDEPFDEFAWCGPYVESGPWQASTFVPHDPSGLASLLGGREQFASKLDKLFSTTVPPEHKIGIHEEREMAALTSFGQGGLSNQPAFHIPYLYAAVGLPSKTQQWTRRACAELFNSGPQGFAGDEDNGSMASWYIFSSLGLYPFCPGTTEYLLTSPAFTKATVHLEGGRKLVISAPGNSAKNIYVEKCQFNNRTLAKSWISHRDLTAGGELLFEMGPIPKPDKISDKDRPYSASKHLGD